MAFATVGLCLGAAWLLRQMTPPEVRKPEVTQSLTPRSRSIAKGRCPIPLPDSANNVQYAVWSFGQVTQSWIRFEAPVEESLQHAQAMLKAYDNREEVTVTTTPIAEDTGVLCVLDPTEVDLSWFDDCQSVSGSVFRVWGDRAPVIWVDTNRGTFYCEVKNERHSMSLP
jgi:hypothetical protein